MQFCLIAIEIQVLSGIERKSRMCHCFRPFAENQRTCANIYSAHAGKIWEAKLSNYLAELIDENHCKKSSRGDKLNRIGVWRNRDNATRIQLGWERDKTKISSRKKNPPALALTTSKLLGFCLFFSLFNVAIDVVSSPKRRNKVMGIRARFGFTIKVFFFFLF